MGVAQSWMIHLATEAADTKQEAAPQAKQPYRMVANDSLAIRQSPGLQQMQAWPAADEGMGGASNGPSRSGR